MFEKNEILPKYEQIPGEKEANWLLFSMHGLEGIKAYLNSFRSDVKKPGCSSTLLWTGTRGNNVPVEPFENEKQKIGIVLNPKYLAVPQADFAAFRSGGLIAPELLKSKRKKTNHPNKMGYERHAYDDAWFFTNFARHECIAGTKNSIYHQEGSAEIFAKNVWRKFYKPNKKRYQADGIMKLNEAIVFQKGNINPIDGVLVTESTSSEHAKNLLGVLREHKHLKLYLYNIDAKEHIVRYLPNAEAILFLQGSYKFNKQFNKAKPFMGYSNENPIVERKNTVARPINNYSSHTETVKIGQQITKNLGITAKINLGIENYIPGNKRHNQQQKISGLQFVFSSDTEKNRFKSMLERANIPLHHENGKTIELASSSFKILAITSQIKVLKKELNGWFYCNKNRKQEKIQALKELRSNARGHEVIDEKIREVKGAFKNLETGFFSSRTKKLLNYLEHESALSYTI